MKKLLIFLGALAAYGTDCTISDTVRTPFGGYFAGRIVVALNSPASAQPLYSGSQTLTGWQTTIEVPSTANGVVAFTLVCTDTITPSGTSYSARYQPTSGSPWSETWTPTTGTTTIRAMRATTVPTPTTTFQVSQIVPGSNGQVLTTTAGATAWGSVPACSTCVVTSGSYADPAWITSLAGSKVSGAVASATTATTATTASTATALAANGTNCAAGTFPLGVDAAGNSETCTALPTTISGTANQITASASTGAVTLSLPTTITGLTSVTSTGFVGALTGNASTATALAANPTNCAAGTLPRGVDASGVGEGCAAVALASEVTGTLANANTTATNANTASAIVARDASGNFTAGTITAALVGNASTATALASTVASGRLWIGQGTGAPTSDSVICADTTQHFIGVGTCAPTAAIDVVGNSGYGVTARTTNSASFGRVTVFNDGSQGINIYALGSTYGSTVFGGVTGSNQLVLEATGATSSFYIGSAGNIPLIFARNRSESMRLSGTTGNLLIGTITDLGYGLHAANKATNGNLLVFDPTATTGTSKAVFVAGQGQSANLTEWRAYNATPGSGTLLHAVAADGIPQWSSIAEPTCNSSNRGKITMVYGGAGVLDTLRVCRKDAADAYAWTALY